MAAAEVPRRRLSYSVARDLPAVPVRQLFGRQPLGRLEIGALGVGDREQATLAVLVVGDAEQLGYFLLTTTNQMQRRPAGAEAARPQRQAVAPHRREQ